MRFDLLHPADQIVMIMERIYAYGMTTTSGGNLSVLDDNGDVWITPGGIDKGTLTRKDIVCVKPDGTTVGIHKPSIETPFHLTIYKSRPDLRAVLHAHPPALVAFSVVRRIPDTLLIPNARLVCGEVGMAPYGLPGSADLGEKIAAVFAQGCDTVMLENHGVVLGRGDLFSAFMGFETLDFCARLQIEAHKLGKPASLSERSVELSRSKQDIRWPAFTPERHSSEENEARRDMVTLIRRAYDQRLFTSTQGTFSQRLSGGDFLITPYHVDRRYMEAEDLVLVRAGQTEAGKRPSRSLPLHQKIYERHPDIHSVIIAHPPNIMAFAVTEEPFDSRIIPESYLMLRDVPKMDFGASFLHTDTVADRLSGSTPVLLVRNDCVIVTGSSLLSAFDRLEVAEYSAKAIIASRDLGDIVTIDRQRIADIDRAFGLA